LERAEKASNTNFPGAAQQRCGLKERGMGLCCNYVSDADH
jgi:hypothetical protein